MTQKFMGYAVQGERRAALTRAAELAGYKVSDAQRMVPGIMIRVRVGTRDEAEVERLVAENAPGAKPLPGGTPASSIVGYRDGYP